jgi:catechol 2,3-dioxygenase-like lactoylglutathione lyase family enzyme
MIVKRIGYVGMRTEHLERMTWFFRDVLGLREAMVGETFSILNLPTGPSTSRRSSLLGTTTSG